MTDFNLIQEEKNNELATEILYNTHHKLFGCTNRDRKQFPRPVED